MPASARKVEDKLTQLRDSVTRLIWKWEGDGKRLYSDDNYSVPCDILYEDSYQFGGLQDRHQCTLDNRAAFLGGTAAYLLWGICGQTWLDFYYFAAHQRYHLSSRWCRIGPKCSIRYIIVSKKSQSRRQSRFRSIHPRRLKNAVVCFKERGGDCKGASF